MEQKYTEAPEIITSVNSEQAKLHIEISLVNVEKEKISLMMDENGCYLSAPSEEVEYAATMSFLRAVKPSEAKATFMDGFLRIEIPFRDSLASYVKVPVE